ncbi:MAG: GGDEF domain-containing protein [Armatimonadetes bacterium]|nr:GGDEF domain-containing protein [Armatimonadota bacterium]
MVEVYGEIAELYQARGRTARAKAGLLAAVALAESLGSRQEAAKGYERLSQWCEEAGEYAEALAYHRQFHDRWKTIHSEDGDRRLRRMQAEYETKHARHEAEMSREYAAEMEQLARTDALTGLANRRTMEEQIRRCFEQSRTENAPLGVAITDIDRFKSVNDTFGHAIGDAVIRQVARLLADVAGQNPAAFAGRYGGEEFVLLLPGLDTGTAIAVCEDFRESVAAFDWATVAPGLRVTVSVGVCGDHTVRDDTAMIARADEQLYVAKQTGRNRVCT